MARQIEVKIGTRPRQWIVWDPDPIGEDGPVAWGPFPTKDVADSKANALHPDDESGNTTVILLRKA